MLLGNLDLLFSDPLAFLRILPVLAFTVGLALLVAITIHEFSHSLAAYLLGDSTSKRLGRMSLNPIRHLDPAGSALFFLVGFGWGKPVPVDDRALRGGRRAMAIVSGAGPVSNLLTAVAFTLPIKLGLLDWPFRLFTTRLLEDGLEGFLARTVATIVLFSIILAVFNLIPLAPLDGSGVAAGLLPASMARSFARFQQYGPPLLMLAIMSDILFGVGIIRSVINPVINYLGTVIVGQSFL